MPPTPSSTETYHVFLASPGDMETERKAVRSFFDTYNHTQAELRGLRFEVLDWENYASAGVGRPQALITEQTLYKYRDSLAMVICLLGQRFGTDTGTHESGTDEEFKTALAFREENNGWPEIKCFFRENWGPDGAPTDDDALEEALAQKRKVTTFRKRLEKDGPAQSLYATFEQTQDFPRMLEADLTRWLNDPERPWNQYSPETQVQKTDASPQAGRITVLRLPELRQLFHRASIDLLTWRTTLPNDQWLDRPELETLLQRIQDASHSVTLLLGEPGCGKSALLARLGQQLEAESIPVLGIKLDFLPETIQDQDGLREYLHLPAAILTCVRALARTETVAILVDQLDALADLVVQHSGRLRVPLELIHELAELENVHVAASCRQFEHRHDPRLRNMDTELLNLKLPAWEQVDATLQDCGLRTASWNKSMREDLRSPHALDTFLRLLKTTDESELLHGYQHMLETSWRQDVLCDSSGKRRRLLLDLTERMADREVFWMPLAVFEDQHSAVLELEAAGILIEDGGRIGFRHQTLFEFVRARTFLEASGRLTEAVVGRQNSLRIRPQLWQALGYMRAVDRNAYLKEIHGMWGSDLRRHLRMLLIEFLGQIQDPVPAETALFFGALDDAWCKIRILAAVAGSRGWFDALVCSGYLPMLMARPPEEASLVEPVLRKALEFDQPTVLRLLISHWIPDPEMDSLTWQLLESVGVWQPGIVDHCCRILARTDVAAWALIHLASTVSMHLPDQAPKLVGTWLRRQWEKELPAEIPTGVQEDDGEIGAQDPWRESAQIKRSRSLLERHDLHDLPAIAEAAPRAFLDAIWTWFLQVMGEVAEEAHPFVIGYREAHDLIDRIDDEEIRIEHPFWAALVLAVEKFATSKPESFVAFVAENEQLDLMVVQRLLAKGMIQIADTRPSVALDFLCADARRFVLGSYSDNHRNTKDLLRVLIPHLDTEQFLRLEKQLLEWSRYSKYPDDGAKTSRDRLRWNRQHRLRLLKSLPRDRMSRSCRRLVEEEERAFPHLRDWDMRVSGPDFIGSPVSAEQMEAGRDEEILNLFAELTDEGGWDHPRRSMEGGAIQAGRELAKLAEGSPERAIRLVRQLQPGLNEIPAGDVLEALAKTDYDRNALFDLICELAERGFGGEHFRYSVASAVQKAVDADHSLTESLFALLDSWLAPTDDSVEEEAEFRNDSNEHRGSLLWGYGGISVLPNGNYPVLAALSKACLQSKPPLTDRWLDIMEGHLSRTESPRVWTAMYEFLRWLHLADHSRAQAFLDQLFLSYPSILNSLEVTHLLAECQRWIDPESAQRWLDRMLADGFEAAAQGMGELLVFRLAQFPDEPWIAKRLDYLVDVAQTDDNLLAARIGIAHSVAHLWRDPQHRKLMHGYLMILLQDQNEGVLDALADIFRSRRLLPDAENRELLDKICEYPKILRHHRTESIGECLETIVLTEPDRVFRARERITSHFQAGRSV